MMLSVAAQVLNGKIVGGDVSFSAVSSDSRKVAKGDLFLALRGDNFDGYAFVTSAAQKGAAAALVNSDSYSGEAAACPMLLVDDTRLALGKLAAYWRSQFDIPLVAITGSNGKTTVKEMLASILRTTTGNEDAVLSTKGNLNNDIGMPLTLLQLNTAHSYAVIEMGMNHSGEIDYLAKIAKPDVVLINNASGAHLEGLGSVEAVALAKGEILNGLSANGTAVINADDEYASLWRGLAGAHQILEFGFNPDADVSGTWQPYGEGLHIDITAPQGMFAAELHVPGEHNALNALAAATAACAMNIPLEKIAAGLEKFGGVAGRMQCKTAYNGANLIDDTYNANPASMLAAIRVLAQAGKNRVLVMGDMGELGDAAARLHEAVGAEARQAGIERLFALGDLSAGAAREFGEGGRCFERIEDMLVVLEKSIDEKSTVLVKGSRFMKMERVVKCLEAGEFNHASTKEHA